MLLNIILQFEHHTTWRGSKQLLKYLLLKASWLFISLAYVANFFKDDIFKCLAATCYEKPPHSLYNLKCGVIPRRAYDSYVLFKYCTITHLIIGFKKIGHGFLINEYQRKLDAFT